MILMYGKLVLNLIACSLIFSGLISCSTPRATPSPSLSTHSRLPAVNPAEIVLAHNRIRNRYKLSNLSWSNQLAKFSQQWANHLKSTNNCQMRHRPHRGQHKTNYGENLLWASPLKWSDGRIEVQKFTSTMVVDDWASEVDYYDYPSNRCHSNKQCGHYTQIVWRDTRQVGCARAICSDSSQVWVCSYDPPGNWAGKQPY